MGRPLGQLAGTNLGSKSLCGQAGRPASLLGFAFKMSRESMCPFELFYSTASASFAQKCFSGACLFFFLYPIKL